MKDLKTKRIALRLTEEEFKQVQKAAKKEDVRISTYLRGMIVGKK